MLFFSDIIFWREGHIFSDRRTQGQKGYYFFDIRT